MMSPPYNPFEFTESRHEQQTDQNEITRKEGESSSTDGIESAKS